jgi:hypothetical protein
MHGDMPMQVAGSISGRDGKHEIACGSFAPSSKHLHTIFLITFNVVVLTQDDVVSATRRHGSMAVESGVWRWWWRVENEKNGMGYL